MIYIYSVLCISVTHIVYMFKGLNIALHMTIYLSDTVSKRSVESTLTDNICLLMCSLLVEFARVTKSVKTMYIYKFNCCEIHVQSQQ